MNVFSQIPEIAENPKTQFPQAVLPLLAVIHRAKQSPRAPTSERHVQQENNPAQHHIMSLQHPVPHNCQTKLTQYCLPHHQHKQRWLLNMVADGQTQQLDLLSVRLR